MSSMSKRQEISTSSSQVLVLVFENFGQLGLSLCTCCCVGLLAGCRETEAVPGVGAIGVDSGICVDGVVCETECDTVGNVGAVFEGYAGLGLDLGVVH